MKLKKNITTKVILAMTTSAFTLTGCATFNANMENPLDRFKPEATAVQTELPPAPKPTWVEVAPDRLPATDWVSTFNEPTLPTLVSEALAANTNVRSAEARWQAAQASAVASRSGLKPTVDFSSRASHSEFGNSRIGDSNSLSLGPNVSWEADLWGRVKDTANAGELEAEASRADYAATRLSIAGATSQAWFDLIESKLLLDLANKNLETQKRALTLTQRRFEGGVAGSSDVRLARSSVASAEANVAGREQLRASTTRRLEILLRRYPEDAIRAAADLPYLPPLEGAGQPADIFKKRPDLLAAERRMQIQGLRTDIARKNLLPRLTLTSDATLSGGDISDLFNIDALIGSIAGGLTAPIFQSGALKAEVERNEAVLKQQLEGYVDTALTAYLEVENALDAEQRLRERESALRVSLEEAQKAEERLAIRYSEGLATILQLLDAQSRAINAESSLISARKERLANRVRLHLALGGGQFGAETDQNTIRLAQN